MITEHQYRRLMKEYQQSGLVGRAALKASMDRKTAARYLAAGHGPEVKEPGQAKGVMSEQLTKR